MNKPRVAFVCVHNSCRSQIAEGLGKLLASDVFECFSAGTAPAERINPDAVRLMKLMYGVDMEQTQYPKVIDSIMPIDILITMGCNVSCPSVPCNYREDWGLDDPSGKDDMAFSEIIEKIYEKVLSFKAQFTGPNNTY